MTSTRTALPLKVRRLGGLLSIAIFVGALESSSRAEEEVHDHDGHDHAAHEAGTGAAGEMAVPVTREQIQRFGIKIATASMGKVGGLIRAPGEIGFNEDRVVHMVPRLSGVVSKVLKTLGDKVAAGESVAVIESRELADAKSAYLAAQAHHSLAEKSFAREKVLHEKQVSSEQDFIAAEVALAQARIERRTARQKLHALGLNASAVEAIGAEQDESLTRFELRSPIDGIITAKHISQGESLQADTGILTVADLSSVWVNLAISDAAIRSVRKGQPVTIRLSDGSTAETEVQFVSPTVDAETRTALVRATLDNATGGFRPGTFVEATIHVPTEEEYVVVPKASVQLVHDYPCVFVWMAGGFELREVMTGTSDNDRIEIVKGLKSGEKVAAVNAFHLKAEYIKSAAGDLGAHHGHSH